MAVIAGVDTVREHVLVDKIESRDQPETPIVVTSPILRPDAESTHNRLGATLAEIRDVIEEVADDTPDVRLVPGFDLVDEDMLPDGIHPGDDGHRAMAAAIGPVVKGML